MNKYILFLSGGKWQEPWVKFLKERGHSIILVDPNKEPICKKHSDVFIQKDVKDILGIKRKIAQLKLKIILVTSEQTDVATLPVAKLSDYYNTKHIPTSTVQRFTNKYSSRILAEKIDASRLPKFKKIMSKEELITFQESNIFNVIIKPPDSQSSRGISVIDKKSKLEKVKKAFEIAKNQTNKDYILAEEYVKGTEITIEGVVIKNKHIVLGASRKKHIRTGIASDLLYPLNLKKTLWKEILKFHNALIEKTNIQFGITHSEYIINEKEEKFWLIEKACRGGGTLIPSHIIPWVSGHSPYEIYYSQLFSKKFKGEIIPAKNTALLHFFEFPCGKISAINGIEECSKIKGVIKIELEFKKGDTLKKAEDDRARHGYVIILVKKKRECDIILKKIYDILKVQYRHEI